MPSLSTYTIGFLSIVNPYLFHYSVINVDLHVYADEIKVIGSFTLEKKTISKAIKKNKNTIYITAHAPLVAVLHALAWCSEDSRHVNKKTLSI